MKILIIIFCLTSILFSQEYNFNNFTITRNIERLDRNDLYSGARLTYDVFDEDNILLYSVDKFVEYDLPYPGALVFNDGSLLIINAFDTYLEFYNNSGNLLTKFNAIEGAEVHYDRIIYYDSEGKFAAIGISHPDNENSAIMVFDNAANKVSEWNIQYKNLTGIKAAENFELIAVAAFKWTDMGIQEKTDFFDIEGNKISSSANKFTKGKFTEDYFIGYTNKSAFLYNLQSKNIIWNYSANNDGLILDILMKSNLSYIIDAKALILKDGKWYYSNLNLKTISNTGNIVKDEIVTSESYLNARFADDEDKITISLDERIIYAE
jgi:hypothetical protein